MATADDPLVPEVEQSDTVQGVDIGILRDHYRHGTVRRSGAPEWSDHRIEWAEHQYGAVIDQLTDYFDAPSQG